MIAKDKAQILVVDDAPNTVEILQRNLQADGYSVFTAGDVASLVAFLKSLDEDYQ